MQYSTCVRRRGILSRQRDRKGKFRDRNTQVNLMNCIVATTWTPGPEQPLGRGSALPRLGAELELRRSGTRPCELPQHNSHGQLLPLACSFNSILGTKFNASVAVKCQRGDKATRFCPFYFRKAVSIVILKHFLRCMVWALFFRDSNCTSIITSFHVFYTSIFPELLFNP